MHLPRLPGWNVTDSNDMSLFLMLYSWTSPSWKNYMIEGVDEHEPAVQKRKRKQYVNGEEVRQLTRLSSLRFHFSCYSGQSPPKGEEASRQHCRLRYLYTLRCRRRRNPTCLL